MSAGRDGSTPPGGAGTLESLFAPPEQNWRRLSPRYRTLRRASVLIGWLPFVAIVSAAAYWLIGEWWAWAPILVAGLAWTVWRWWRMDALWRSWGYAELADDLYVTHGLWFRQLSVVPYGRMQVVEVESGPIERALGLATVKLVTASATTDATIPGLTPGDAAQLRDRLTELGETRTSGL